MIGNQNLGDFFIVTVNISDCVKFILNTTGSWILSSLYISISFLITDYGIYDIGRRIPFVSILANAY